MAVVFFSLSFECNEVIMERGHLNGVRSFEWSEVKYAGIDCVSHPSTLRMWSSISENDLSDS